MTVLNFPSTAGKPTDGSFQYIANGVVYSWDGEKWVSNTQANGGGGGRSEPVHFDGPDAPDFDSLIAGDQWYNTNDGRLYTYTLNDNNDLVWVDASPDSSISLWERTGTTLEPTNDGDDISVGAGTFSDDVNIGNTNVVLRNSSNRLDLRTQSATGTSELGGTLTVNEGAMFVGNGNTFGIGEERSTNSSVLYSNTQGTNLELGVRVSGTRIGHIASVRSDGVYIGNLPTNPNITLHSNGGIVTAASPTTHSFDRNQDQTSTNIIAFRGLGTTRFEFRGGGGSTDARKTAAGQFSALSDVRAKNSITDYTSGLQQITSLRPVNYKLNGNEGSHIGLIAQEVEKVMPEMVTVEVGEIGGSEVQDRRILDPTAIQYALINAAKEMAARIEALEAKVQQLEGGTN